MREFADASPKKPTSNRNFLHLALSRSTRLNSLIIFYSLLDTARLGKGGNNQHTIADLALV